MIARAITADLVTDLSKVSDLQVASGFGTSGSIYRRGRDQARARYVLSGTLQGDGERLRLHIHLADAVAGRQLWSQRFDRDAKDLFAVQDDLVRSVLAVLPVKLSEAETLRLAQRYTRNPKPMSISFAARPRCWCAVRRRTSLRARCTGRRSTPTRRSHGRTQASR